MSVITGEVAFINERSAISKKTGKPFKAYSIKLKLENGNLSENLNAGFKAPEVRQGDYVSVTVEKNANGYEDIKAISKIAKPAPAPASNSNTGRSSGAADESNGVDGGGVADRQTQIVLQHSQEMAIAEVALLLQHSALPLSAATNKAGMTKRYDEITQAIEKLTVQRFFDVVTARLLDSVADAGEVDTGADAPIPAHESSTTTEDDE